MKVRQCCTPTVVCARRDSSIVRVAELMRSRHVGAVVVVEDDEGPDARPVGVVTDRDLVVAVLGVEIASSAAFCVGDIIRDRLVTVPEDEDLLNAIVRMRDERVRRMPVVTAGGRLCGMLSLDDALEALVEVLREIPRLLREQREEEMVSRR